MAVRALARAEAGGQTRGRPLAEKEERGQYQRQIVPEVGDEGLSAHLLSFFYTALAATY